MPSSDAQAPKHPPWRIISNRSSQHEATKRLSGKSLSVTSHEFRDLEIFQSCSKEFIMALSASTTHHKHSAGDFIVKKGSQLTSMLYLLRGQAIVYLDRECTMPVSTLSPRSYIGEMSLLGLQSTSSIAAQAQEECWVIEVSAASFDQCLQSHPDAQEFFGRIMMRNLSETVAQGIVQDTCEILQGLPIPALAELASILVNRIYFPGEIVMLEGTVGQDLFFLDEGQVEVLVGGKVVWKQQRGQKPVFFGELGLLGIQTHRSASIVANSICCFGVLFHSMFLAIVQSHHGSLEVAKIGSFLNDRYHGDENLNTRKRLREVGFFKDGSCSESFMDYLEAHVEERVFLTGQAIVEIDGAEDKSMYVLSQGQAIVLKEGHAVARLDIGAVFGEAVLLGLSAKRSNSIMAATTCYAYMLPQEVVIKGLEMYPSERQKMLMMAFKKKRDLEGAMEANSNASGARQENTVAEQKQWSEANESGQAADDSNGSKSGAKAAHFKDIFTARKTLLAIQAAGKNQAKNAYAAIAAKGRPDGRDEDGDSDGEDDPWRANNKMNVLKALRNSKMFSQVDESFVNDLSKVALDRICMPGEIIIENGTTGDSMFIVISGKANVCSTQIDQKTKTQSKSYIGVLEAGAICGELAMLGVSSKRSATIEAESICCLWEVRHDAAMRIINGYPDIQNSFLNTIVAHLEHTVPTTIDSLKIFEPFGRKFRMLLGLYCERRAYFNGTQIFKEGQHSDGLYILNHGQGFLECKGTTIQTYSPGAFFNAVCMLGLVKTCLCTLIAYRTCQIILISRTSWMQALEQYPARREEQELRKQEMVKYETFKKVVHRTCTRRVVWKQNTGALFAPAFENSMKKIDIKRFFFVWKVFAVKSIRLRKQAQHTREVFENWVTKKREFASLPRRSISPAARAHTSWFPDDSSISGGSSIAGGFGAGKTDNEERRPPTTPRQTTATHQLPSAVEKSAKHSNLFNLYLYAPRTPCAEPAQPRTPSSARVSTPRSHLSLPATPRRRGRADPPAHAFLAYARPSRAPTASNMLPSLVSMRGASDDDDTHELWTSMGTV